MFSADLRLIDGRGAAIAHRTDFESLLLFQVSLAKELFHDAVCPLAIEVERLGGIAQVSTVNQRLQ